MNFAEQMTDSPVKPPVVNDSVPLKASFISTRVWPSKTLSERSQTERASFAGDHEGAQRIADIEEIAWHGFHQGSSFFTGGWFVLQPRLHS